MRRIAFLLLVLLIAVQYPLWFGKGGWLKVIELKRSLAAERQSNDQLRARNAALDAEVRDLKTGHQAIEERARSELGMIKKDEIFVQVVPSRNPASERPPAKKPLPQR
jgi:cell division protein FtsB